eukprot:790075-Prorocentrum_minimum.AAC.1
MPLVFATLSRVLRRAWRLHLTDTSPIMCRLRRVHDALLCFPAGTLPLPGAGRFARAGARHSRRLQPQLGGRRAGNDRICMQACINIRRLASTFGG